jgi:hypothetical protein
MDSGFVNIHNVIMNAHVLIQGVFQQDVDGYEFNGATPRIGLEWQGHC